VGFLLHPAGQCDPTAERPGQEEFIQDGRRSFLRSSSATPEYGFRGPQGTGNTSVTIHLHVANADEMAQRACEAGATMLRPPKDEFYAERSCRLRDSFGHEWSLGHHIEDVTREEIQRRYAAMFK
jgi:uncharacterized glyoxalase superfamily protein PhnB